MLSSQYRFVTRWRVEGTPEEVYRLIDDPADFVKWWPAVWLRVQVLDHGDRDGVGKVVRYLSKGWLPYLLQWTARTLEKDRPNRIVLHASGDFEGEGRWSFRADGPNVDVEYVWTIEANKPLLRYLSFLLRPIFAANHRWAMARGEESLRLELSRRRAKSADELARVPHRLNRRSSVSAGAAGSACPFQMTVTSMPNQFEILPADVVGPSLILPRKSLEDSASAAPGPAV